MAAGALYYPYTHIEDVNWLKATLLLFPHVERMLPSRPDGQLPESKAERAYVVDDARDIAEYKAVGLLRPANLFSARVLAAEQHLVRLLNRDAARSEFRARFGWPSAKRVYGQGDPYGFQIHKGKLTGYLLDILRSGDLAWQPWRPERYVDRDRYVGVHPSVGQAIMATLATACATADGLTIVGDARSGPLHRCIVEKDTDAIYATWLRKPRPAEVLPARATGDGIFGCLINLHCDLSRLQAKDILSLADEREALADFKKRLQRFADNVPVMDDGPQRLEHVRRAAEEVLSVWEKERRFFRRLLKAAGVEDGPGLAAKATEKVVTKVLKDAGPGGLVGLTWHGLHGAILGAAAGLGIGIVTGAVTAGAKIKRRDATSPFRYLTLMQKHGVTFVSSPGIGSNDGLA
jgi:hypothetical protein